MKSVKTNRIRCTTILTACTIINILFIIVHAIIYRLMYISAKTKYIIRGM